MKNFLKILLVVSLIACIGLTFAACSDEELDFEDNCTHTYSNDCDVDCNECGEERTVSGHTPDSDDGDCTTPITCKVCGATVSAGKTQHVAGADDGDCTTAVKCVECDTVAVAVKEHDFSGEWKSDKDGHWHACANEKCGVTDTKAAHKLDNEGKCETCNYDGTEPCTHEANIIRGDADGHWHECACGESKTEKANHTPKTEGIDCADGIRCSACEWLTTPAGNHTPAEDDGDCTTDVKCSVCGKTAASGNSEHVDNDGDDLCDETGCDKPMSIGNEGANTETGWGQIITPNRK